MKTGEVSLLNTAIPAIAVKDFSHHDLLATLIKVNVASSAGNLQAGSKFHILETGNVNQEIGTLLSAYTDQVSLWTVTDQQQTGTYDIVVSTLVKSGASEELLAQLKPSLKENGLLVLEVTAGHPDILVLLSEAGYEQMIIYPLDHGGHVILAKSNGLIQVRREAELTALPVVKNSALAVLAASVTDSEDTGWLMAKLVTIAAATIALPEEEFEVTTQFKDYGFDSIIGIELINALNAELNLTLKATDLYNYPNITLLNAYLQKNFAEVLRPSVQQVEAVVPTVIAEKEIKVNQTAFTPGSSAEIAIIGISGQFGTANDLDAYWEVLKEGRSLITPVSAEKWSEDENSAGKTRWASCLTDAACFDPLFFKLSGAEAEMMDPMQRLFLEHSWKAIEDAGINADQLSEVKCGVYAGAGQSDYAAATEGTLPSALWGNSSAILASRISYFLNLKGPAIAVNTACSSSLVAIDLGFNSLQRGDTDLVLAGGVNIINSAQAYTMAIRAGMLSADGRCYTFDSRANGFVMGEGVGVIVLKRLADAERDNDRIYGVIKGSLTNQDGTTNGITAPSVLSQQELEKEVYNRFNINPETISYVEAHGTGTSLGDPIEFEALTASFRSYTAKNNFCALGSVKTNIGHALEAAGIASVLKVVLAIKHQQLPPTINYKQHNPLINFEGSPFRIQDQLTAWGTPENTRRRAAVSSFGFSGTNAHMVIEEYTPVQKSGVQNTGEALILLSAKNKEQLILQAEQLIRHIQKEPAVSLYNMAYTLQTGRSLMEERLAVTVRTVNELIACLTDFSTGKTGRYYHENIRKHKKTVAHEISERTVIQNAVANKLWDTLAVYWVKGFRVEWDQLYQDSKPDKITLPHYPFFRERFWLKSTQGVATSTVVLHPLLHTNNSTLNKQQFSSRFTGTELFLRDHKVLGDQVLPGVAYLEMARAAGAYATEAAITQFKEVNWLQPVKVNASPVEVHLSLQAKGSEVMYEIYTSGEEKQLHGQGVLNTLSLPAPATRDLHKLRSSLTPLGNGSSDKNGSSDRIDSSDRVGHQQGADYYAIFRSIGLDYGKTFQGIQQIYYSEEAALSSLSLAAETGFSLSAGMMDGALQTCMAMSLLTHNQQLMLPFSVREINIYQPLPEEIWCYARKNSSGKSASSYEIELLNGAGEVLISFTELVVLPLEINRVKPALHHNQVVEVSDGLNLYTHNWHAELITQQEQELSNTVPLVFLAGGSALLAEKLEERLECEVRLISENTPEGVFIHILEEFQQRKLAKTMVQFVYAITDELDYSFISGMLKTAVQESALLLGKTIGVESLSVNELSSLSGILLAEQANPAAEVRYQNGQREVKELQVLSGIQDLSRSAESSKTIELSTGIKENGVYLITGGAGGLGLIFAAYLNKVNGTKVILAGRSLLGAAQLELIKTMSHVVYERCDMTRIEEVKTLVGKIKNQYGHLNGIIHSAGVTRDSLLLHKTAVEVRDVFSAKVNGAKNIDEATQQEQLDFMIYCSSLAGVFGNTGQSDYAAANAWLDHFANYREQKRNQGKRTGKTLSINWPLWKEGGMQISAEQEKYMAHHFGLLPMPTADGLQALEQLLNHTVKQGTVIYGNPDKLGLSRSQHIIPALSLTAETPAVAALYSITPLTSAILEKPASVAVADDNLRVAATVYLGELLAAALKIPVARLQPDLPFEQFGIDSTIVIRLTNLLEESLGKVSRTVFFECQTLDELVSHFLITHRDVLYTITGIAHAAAIPVNVEATPVAVSTPFIPATLTNLVPEQRTRTESRVGKEPQLADDVAIIGISGRYPGARNLNEFWENLKAGKDSITEIPDSRWKISDFYDPVKGKNGKTYSKWGGFMDDVDLFDPLFFNISPREAEIMDPQERLFLQTVWETMEDAGYTRARLQGKTEEISGLAGQVGVYVGVMYEEYQLFGPQETANGNPTALLGNPSSIANRISYFFNFHGPSMAVDTMCSSSLTAIHLACKDLQSGEIEMAVAGGVNLSLHQNKFLILSEGGFASSKGRCESFGEGGEGYVPGEGVGAVLLKPLSRAIADGDRIYGVIKGTAVNHGGKTNGYTVPNPKAQTAVVKTAMKRAGVKAEDFSYIEAHGTGTSLGDPIELTGLKNAFESAGKQFCSIGSVKSNIGHCESAAGISGLTKVLLQMQHRQLVPSLHSDTLNPNIDFENSPFKVQQELEEWPSVNQKARLAGISSFGAGGSNAHIIIEEYIAPEPEHYSAAGPALILLSAKDASRLKDQVINLKNLVQERPELSVYAIAYTLQTGREAMDERLAFLAADRAELLGKLTNYLENKMQDLLTGNTRKDDPGFLLEGKAGKAYLESAILERESHSLIQLWIKGVVIDWNLLYPNKKPAKISLPAYPFARERYWFQQQEKTALKHSNQLHPLLHTADEKQLHPLLHTYKAELTF